MLSIAIIFFTTVHFPPHLRILNNFNLVSLDFMYLLSTFSSFFLRRSLILLYDLVSLQAQSAAVAEVWLWQVGSWKSVGRLQSHSLTVTQMEFSHDDNFLLTVSRDRQFSVFTITRTGRLVIDIYAMQAYAFAPFMHLSLGAISLG